MAALYAGGCKVNIHGKVLSDF